MVNSLSKTYRVVETFYSIQGEGPQVGTPALFIRLFGCNLNCSFCDTPSGKEFQATYSDTGKTDFSNKRAFIGPDPDRPLVRYEVLTVEDILYSLQNDFILPFKPKPMVVITGGEPLLQDLEPLILGLLGEDYPCIGIETNGLIYPAYAKALPEAVHFVVSPKRLLGTITYNQEWLIHKNNLVFFKFVIGDIWDYPGPEFNNKLVYLQPMSSSLAATKLCIDKLKGDKPSWKLSLQIHKILGLR